MQPIWQAIAQHLSEVTRDPLQPLQYRSVSGGSINAAYRLSCGQKDYFVKLARGDRSGAMGVLEMFAAEAAGLQTLAAADAIRIPQPLIWGSAGEQAYLVLEYLDLTSPRSQTASLLGSRLAQLHRTLSPNGRYGWDRNNTIGSTPQINRWTSDWLDFYREHRLLYQVKLACQQGYRDQWVRQAERVMAELEVFFHGYKPDPALLHGDLWGGNYGALPDGTPVIFDPALYYGDRETDLAMTELFGGFPAEFYQAYQRAYPLDLGYPNRKPLYQLYHWLNHLNLFGEGYMGSVSRALQQCLGFLDQNQNFC
ncbi:MAG: fructosamine kinase family protein [Thermostichus sp. DG02_5_bins_236]